MLSGASAAIHLCLVIMGFGSRGLKPRNHAPCFDGASGSRGCSGNSRADMRQCMIHLSQLTNVSGPESAGFMPVGSRARRKAERGVNLAALPPGESDGNPSNCRVER
jgi:hypothetical protein